MLQSLESFLKMRERQSKTQAFLIRKYLKHPDRWMGSKNFTEADARMYDQDVEKCRAALAALGAQKPPPVKRKINSEPGAADSDVCVFCNRSAT